MNLVFLLLLLILSQSNYFFTVAWMLVFNKSFKTEKIKPPPPPKRHFKCNYWRKIKFVKFSEEEFNWLKHGKKVKCIPLRIREREREGGEIVSFFTSNKASARFCFYVMFQQLILMRFFFFMVLPNMIQSRATQEAQLLLTF